jgi:DNA-binding NtrC family response regulator
MRQDEIDAVLLDMNMPGLSGEAVFRELVSLRPDVKVLLSSGYTEQETAARFKHSRLAGFVHKPYTVNGLVEKIGAALVNAE